MKLLICYHWSPTKNREKICKEGLTLFNSSIEYENNITGIKETWKPGYICSSLDPRTAYIYVIPTFSSEVPSMDLYSFDLIDTDEIILSNDHTREIIEVRILNSIPADRIHYIATREAEY
jgi:hypothetical protein